MNTTTLLKEYIGQCDSKDSRRMLLKILLKGISPNEKIDNDLTLFELLACLGKFEEMGLCLMYGASVDSLPWDLKKAYQNYTLYGSL